MLGRFRISERIILLFFLWASLLAITLPLSGAIKLQALGANATVCLTYLFLTSKAAPAWSHSLRDWIPQVFLLLAYKEMGWFALHNHTHELERGWIVWDRKLLDDWQMRAAIESLGALLPSLLELSYLLVYILPPATILILYALRLDEKVDTMLSVYLLAMFLCYGQFPFWPSDPPRALFPGQDMPNVTTPLRTFNLWICGNYGIHTSVFPSAHVAGAVAASLGFRYLTPQRYGLRLVYGFYALFVSVATIYGRYHYAVDALGGFVMAILAYCIVLWLKRPPKYA